MRQVSVPSAALFDYLPVGNASTGTDGRPLTAGASTKNRGTGGRFVLLLWFCHDFGKCGCGKRNCHNHRDGGHFPLSSRQVTNGTADRIFSQESFPTDWNRRNQCHHVAFRNNDSLVCPSSSDFGSCVVSAEKANIAGAESRT